MEDSAILDLYFARSEQAIAETDRKYGPYCYSVAYHILEDRRIRRKASTIRIIPLGGGFRPGGQTSWGFFWGALPGTSPLTAGAGAPRTSGAAGSCRWCWKSWRSASPAGRVRRRT